MYGNRVYQDLRISSGLLVTCPQQPGMSASLRCTCEVVLAGYPLIARRIIPQKVAIDPLFSVPVLRLLSWFDLCVERTITHS